jgi:tRNA pseudouridine38-40 synthase
LLISMTRIALRVAYDGAGRPGWQTQPDGCALQDHLEQALSTIAGGAIRTICAGRTDAGVHATAQLVHFDSPVDRPLSAWVRGTNARLSARLAVQAAAVVDTEFHARYSACRRHYTYLLLRAPQRQPLLAGRVGWVHRPLDIDAMRLAAQALVGTHDFSAFRSSQCQARSPVRTLEQLVLIEHGTLLVLTMSANAFLHHMVRNLVGALVWVGLGRRPPGWIAEILAERDRRRGAPTFAADGLYLTGVKYDRDPGLGTWPPDSPPALYR